MILARAGRLVIDEASHRVELHLERRRPPLLRSGQAGGLREQRFRRRRLPAVLRRALPAVPPLQGGPGDDPRGAPRTCEDLRAEGKGPRARRFEVEWHKKFAIPAACLVFGLLGLGLSLGSNKEARSAAFGLSIAVIFVYYVIIRLGEQAGDTGLIPPFSPCGGPTSSWAPSR